MDQVAEERLGPRQERRQPARRPLDLADLAVPRVVGRQVRLELERRFDARKVKRPRAAVAAEEVALTAARLACAISACSKPGTTDSSRDSAAIMSAMGLSALAERTTGPLPVTTGCTGPLDACAAADNAGPAASAAARRVARACGCWAVSGALDAPSVLHTLPRAHTPVLERARPLGRSSRYRRFHRRSDRRSGARSRLRIIKAGRRRPRSGAHFRPHIHKADRPLAQRRIERRLAENGFRRTAEELVDSEPRPSRLRGT